MKIAKDKIEFSDGATDYANCGIIGLAPDGDIYQGYDGSLYAEHMEGEIQQLSKIQRIELSEYMISAWQKVKEVAENE